MGLKPESPKIDLDRIECEPDQKSSMKRITPILSASDLLELHHNKDLFIVDAGSGPTAKENYLKKHLEGALYVDLNDDLSNIKDDASQGGRHPLPTLEQFSETLSNLGIRKTSHVIIYDMNHGANAAARFWWMLRAIGHEMVQVLNGGQQAAEQIGFPMSSNIEKKPGSNYVISDWSLPIAEMDEVEFAIHSQEKAIIDVRGTNRYQGIEEPIDLIAGHIPNAINIPYSENLDDNGCFRSPEGLKNKYKELIKNSDTNNTIIHCGSGVTACHTILAMDYAGIPIPKLYVGSWSEWSRNNKDMITQ
jgi:thiosulfate/3-mercaptopyruvate sulfurtransferase